ncbi:hypothetical protein [Streptomyces sp. NPDC001880]
MTLLPPAAPAPAAQAPVQVPQQRQSPALEPPVAQETELAQLRAGDPQPTSRVSSAAPVRQPGPAPDNARAGGRLADAYRAWLAAYNSEPTSEQFALWLQNRYGIATAAGDPLSDTQLEPLLRVLKQHAAPAREDRPGSDAASQGAADEETWADYFYNAWLTYAAERGSRPDAAALAEYVYQRDGIMGATGQPVTADELRDYVALFQERGQSDPEADSVPAAADETAETTPDHEGREGNEEERLPSSPDGDLPAAERHAVHASGGEGGGRSVVQVRVPQARGEDDLDAGESVPDMRESEVEPADGSHLTGPARVEFHYRQLSLQEWELSAKALAPVLAERCGYREGTVRKYLGQIKRAAGM